MRAVSPAVASTSITEPRRPVAQLVSFVLALLVEVVFPAAPESGGRAGR